MLYASYISENVYSRMRYKIKIYNRHNRKFFILKKNNFYKIKNEIALKLMRNIEIKILFKS